MTTIPAPASSSLAPAQKRARNRRTLIGTGAGNAVEWYDWAIYATFASFISSQLFSREDPASAFLATLAIFAVGFVARPFGGFLFGWIGDRMGRKASLTLCVGLASLGSLVIGVTPTFDAIGPLASLILLVARLIQGLAHGGELPSAQTYLSEMAPASRRGYWASLIYVSGTIGIMFGTLLGAVLATALPESTMAAYGWRIPFILGAVLGLVALVMRTKMEESEISEADVVEVGADEAEALDAEAARTEANADDAARVSGDAGQVPGAAGSVSRSVPGAVVEADSASADANTAPSSAAPVPVNEDSTPVKPGLFADLAAHWRQALQVIGLTVGITVVYYVWGVSTPAYAINVLGIEPTGALWAGLVANVVFIAVLPLWGRLSDRIGRKPVMLMGLVGAMVFYFPATFFLRDAAWQLAISMAVMLFFIAAFAAIAPAVFAELFPTSVRTIGVGIPYSICVAAFGGTAAYLQAAFATWFPGNGSIVFGIYAMTLLVFSGLTVLTLKETRGKVLSGN